MPTGTYGGVRGWGREAPAYSIGSTGNRQKDNFQQTHYRGANRPYSGIAGNDEPFDSSGRKTPNRIRCGG